MKNNYYNKSYFDWQKKSGLIGGELNVFKFKKFINPNDTVLDFGCGGGYLLNNLLCKRKIGVEINDIARQNASELGIEVFKYSEDVPDNLCDIIISNHALEHTLNPYEEIKMLYSKLKQNGKIIFVVPSEMKKKWKPNDIHKHLYTWAEINIGNLFDAAGYDVLIVKEVYHLFPPYYMFLYDFLGKNIFHLLCKCHGFIRRNLSEIHIVATKKS